MKSATSVTAPVGIRSRLARATAATVALALGVSALVFVAGSSAEATPFGVSEESVLSYSPASSGAFVGSPTLEVLADGSYLAASNRFGSGSSSFGPGGKRYTEVLRSTDKGDTWTRTAVVEPMFWATIFELGDAVYLMGIGAADEYDNIVISRSTDGGLSWTQPTVLFSGTYHTGDTPIAIANGRIYKTYEHYLGGSWGNFRALAISADLGADLLNPASWTKSTEGTTSLVLEGNPVVDRTGHVVNLLRWHGHPEQAFMARISDDGTTLTEVGGVAWPEGVPINKFYVLYDAISDRYLMVGNQETTYTYSGLSHQRNVLSLYESYDLTGWKFVTNLATDDQRFSWEDSVRRSAFSQPTMQIDGDELLLVSRTASNGASSNHDTNQMTFHRYANFRTWLGRGDEVLHLGFDDPTNLTTLAADVTPSHSIVAENVAGSAVVDGSSGGAFRPSSGANPGIDLGFQLHPTLWNASGLTVSSWVRAGTTIPSNGVIVQTAVNGTTTGVELSLRSDNTLRAEVRPSAGSAAVVRTIPYPTDGAWHQVAMSADLVGGALHLYIDGAEVDAAGSTVSFGSPSYEVANPTAHDRVGSATSGALLPADLDELRVWRTALTGPQIAELYAPTQPSLSGVTVNGTARAYTPSAAVQTVTVTSENSLLAFATAGGVTASPASQSVTLQPGQTQRIDVTITQGATNRVQTFIAKRPAAPDHSTSATVLVLSNGVLLYPTDGVNTYHVTAGALPGKTPAAVTISQLVPRSPKATATVVSQPVMTNATPTGVARITAQDGTTRDISVVFDVVSSDLVGHWKFDETACCTWGDSSVYGNTATGTGTPSAGAVGGSIALGGSTRVVLGDQLDEQLSGAKAISVAGWIRPTAIAASGENNVIFGTRINAQSAGVDVLFDGQNLRVAGRSAAGDSYQQKRFAYPNDGAWHHIAAILDYQNKQIRLYLDGVEQTPNFGNGVTPSWSATSYTPGTPTNPSTIGGSPSSGLSFTGRLDDMRVLGKALSASDVQALYAMRDGGGSGGTLTPTSCDAAASAAGMVAVEQAKLPVGAWSGVYDYDATATVGAVDRVGYCLELAKPSGTDWVLASMQAYNSDASKLGIPVASTDIRRERVSGLDVQSNVPGVTTGPQASGYLEMWNLDYTPTASGQVAGASATLYDADDTPMATGSYGSFQVHSVAEGVAGAAAPKTVLAVNGWNQGPLDIGIGQSAGANPDWTFAKNGAAYTARTLTVFVHQSLVSLTEHPEDLRLYPRDTTTNKADVIVRGTADPSVTGVELRLTRQGDVTPLTATVAPAAGGAFTVSVPITAETRRYDAQLLVTTAAGTMSAGQWTGLLAGDVIVVQGQSNAEAIARQQADVAANAYLSEWVRSYGTPDQSPVISVGEHSWNYAQGFVGTSNNGTRWNAGHVGIWALQAAAQLVNSTGIPVALINGARGGQAIEYFARDDANPGNSANNYGRLYLRMKDAGLLGSVRALFYYQGESDQNRAAEHTAGFGALLQDWTSDFARGGAAANIQYYAFQVRNSCAVQTTGIDLREAQRTLSATFPGYHLTTLSTSGIAEHDGCHYPYANGYSQIAEQATGVLQRDFFGGSGAGLSAPNPASVTGMTSSNVIEVQLQNTSDPLVVTGNPAGDFGLEGTSAQIVSVASPGNGVLRLTLSAPLGSTTAKLTYYGHNGTGPTVATTKHVGLLMFRSLPVTIADAPPADLTLQALTLDGVGVPGFSSGTTTYSITGSGMAPVVVATPTDASAVVEVSSSASQVKVKLSSADGAHSAVYTVYLTPAPAQCAVAAPWHTAAWGPAAASSFCQLGTGSFRIGDGNVGLWTASDAVSTVYQADALPVGGALEVTLSSMTQLAKLDTRAGILVRNDLSRASGPSTGYGALVVSSQNGVFLQRDSNGDGWIDWEGSKTALTAPVQLRLVRTDAATVVGYARASVTAAWTTIGTLTLVGADSGPLDVGMFANSNLSSATLDQGVFTGAVLSTSAAPAVGVPTPAISGTPTIGQTLAATVGTTDPAGASLGYQWLRGGVPIAGATSATYTLTASDGGAEVSVQVTGSAIGRTSTSVVSAVVSVPVQPSVTIGFVSVAGTPTVGQTLTASATASAGATVSYQWQRNGTNIAGATSAARAIVAADAGTVLRVVATASAPGAVSATATSVPLTVTSLVGAWSFDATSAANSYPDLSGNGRVLGSTLATAPGPRGNAMLFPGNGRGVIQPNPTGAVNQLVKSLNGATATTVAAWIRPTNLPTSGTAESNWVLGLRINAAGAGIDVNFKGNQLQIAGRSQASDSYRSALFAYPNDGRWHHIAAVYDYTGKTITLYLDGVAKPAVSVAFSSNTLVAGTPSEVDSVGSAPTYGTGWFTGGIDELRVYSSRISASDIAALAVPEAPAVMISASPAVPASGWYPASPTVTAQAAVLLQTPGVIQYRVDGGAWTDLTESATGAVTLPALANGEHTVEARAARDGVNGAIAVAAIKVDSVAPTVGLTADVAANGAHAEVTVTATDAGSGVASVEWKLLGDASWTPYTGPITLVGAGNYVIQARATDVAGNLAAIEQLPVTVPDPFVETVTAPQGPGTARVDDTLTVIPGAYTPAAASESYEWFVDGVSVGTGASYVPTASDAGLSLTAVVTASYSDTLGDWVDAATPLDFGNVAPGVLAASAEPTLSGSPVVGETVDMTVGTFTPAATLGYQWSLDGSAIAGATASAYTPVVGDLGGQLTVVVTATRPGYTTWTRTLDAGTVIQVPVETVTAPQRAGEARLGGTASVVPGSYAPSGATVGYQWYLDGIAVPAATGLTFTPGLADVGLPLTVVVTASAPNRSDAVATLDLGLVQQGLLAVSAEPALTGQPLVGGALAVTVGTFTPAATVGYQWFLAGTAVPGATGPAFTPATGDVGKLLTVQVTASATGYAAWSRTLTAGAVALVPIDLALSLQTVAAGGRLVVTASGLTPGGEVELVLHSTPVTLATVTASQAGTIEVTVTIPAGTAAGAHTLAVTDLQTGATASAALTVTATGLAGTGAGPATPWVAVAALLALLLGAAAVASRLRRREG